MPRDRASELAAELDPVLTMLAHTDAECGRIVARAQHKARRIAERLRLAAGTLSSGIAADHLRAGEGRGRLTLVPGFGRGAP